MNYDVILPSHTTPESIVATGTLKPYDPIVIEFIEALSQTILGDVGLRQYPELVAMAFWMRLSHLQQMQRHFDNKQGEALWLARGTVFHITPANVDSIFIYSWFISLLAGNANIIRLSSTQTLQIEALFNILKTLLEKPNFSPIRQRTLLVRYGYDPQATAFFSQLCDVRVIWGGDRTIETIRTIPLKSTATEIVFADKFSLAAIRAKAFLSDKNKEIIIERFYNDAYWFAQMACSSPKLVIWEGERSDIKKAQDIFWLLLGEKLIQKTSDMPVFDLMNKLVASCSLAIRRPVKICPSANNLINRVELDSLQQLETELHCGSGLFWEYSVTQLGEIFPHLSRKYQTLAIFGFKRDEIFTLLKTSQFAGIDRVVQLGQALTFSTSWDGYDLQREFVREIAINF
ncbi:MAG: acyl-CoA reductase [Nostoc sp. ChiSLP01]|nr:acyl-CoA reductase [Nostoc sp. CmiSLP01]MDZ8284686.1 acyl-CoA reductase [Nostoc sp. ChiSLP01]